MQDRILALIAAGTEAQRVDKPGGIFLRRSEQLSEEDRVLLQTVARAILTDSAETLAEQVERRAPIDPEDSALRADAVSAAVEQLPCCPSRACHSLTVWAGSLPTDANT